MAYAAVVSLKQILEGLLDSSRSRVQIPNPDLDLIHQDLCYLKSFFDKLDSLEDRISVEELEKQVQVLLQPIQDLIEYHISDIFFAGSENSGDEISISGFSRDLLELKQELCSLIKTIKDRENQKLVRGFTAEVDVTSEVDLDEKVELADADFYREKGIVGLDEELARLLYLVMRNSSDRTEISIVGMGGIGKTTLAREVFLHPLFRNHFDILLFVEIGVEWHLKELLLRLVGQVVPGGRKKLLMVGDLGVHLHQYLFGRRYLIVLDDMWHIDVLHELKYFIPDNRNGSAIILTTRLGNVAQSVSGKEKIIKKRFLDDDESWNLLHRLVFSGMESYPLELIEIGKIIAASSGGLPLAIVMIGKILSKLEASVKIWRAAAQHIDSLIWNWNTTIPNIMDPSSTQLPPHLKPCFLYLGIFPPNYAIPATQIIKLWVAEGFIVPEADTTLEQVAEEYLKDLVSRSLITVHELNSRGKIKTFRLHSIIRDLCVSKARQENLFDTAIKDGTSFPQDTKNQRRLGIHGDARLGSKQRESISATRSLVFVYPPTQDHHHQLQISRRLRGLRVLDALPFSYWDFPDEVLQLVRLRYLAITCDGELPSSISILRNLEVLIVHRSESMVSPVSLPLEIWKLHKLRHIEYMGCYLPHPSTAAAATGDLENLLTLSGVCAHSVNPGVLARMPNLVKLWIWFGFVPTCDTNVFSSSSVDYNLTNLQDLESFKLGIMNRDLRPEAAASSLISFPYGLRKISLSGCGFPWEHMRNIAELPNLEILKLRWSAFCGPVWEIFEGRFESLKYLMLEDLDVEEFIMTDSYPFPRLQHLVIRRCYGLREISSEVGDVPTLETIEVDDCSMSLVESATRILEEQQEMGHDYLQVRIYP